VPYSVFELFGYCYQLFFIDVSHAVRDFFDTANFEALAFFYRLDKHRRINQ
jgi:hypothetical protein